MKNILLIIIKFSFSISLIYGFGFLFLVTSPNKEKDFIQSANADIFSLTGIDEEHNFIRAVSAMGIKPRPYDFNGNLMYFGNGYVDRSFSANEAANKIQNQLVTSGVNQENYLNYFNDSQSKENSKKYRDAMLNGELVPILESGNSVRMTGIIGIKSVESMKDKFKSLPTNTARADILAESIRGYRYIEVNQPENSNTAELLAIWTDEKFDVNKMANTKNSKQSAPDPKIPACVGCERVRRIQALDKSEPYNINKWVTTSTIENTYDFYLSAMQRRGWKASERQQLLDKFAKHLPNLANIKGRGLALEKDGKTINITILPNGNNGSEVFSLEKYEDTQPILDSLPIEPNSSVRDTIGNWFK